MIDLREAKKEDLELLYSMQFIRADKDSVQIIGGADGPTSVFLAGEVPSDMK